MLVLALVVGGAVADVLPIAVVLLAAVLLAVAVAGKETFDVTVACKLESTSGGGNGGSVG